MHSSAVPMCSLSQGIQPFVGPMASAEMVSSRPDFVFCVLSHLRFRDPDHFRTGIIHGSLPMWEHLLADYCFPTVDLLEIVREGVRVERFFPPFRGDFKGLFYNMETPPAIRIKKSAVCA
jgi:hypothetical protein